MLVPGFIDAQVNGGGGVLLNDAPTAEAMDRIAAAHRTFGTCRLLPTLVTTSDEVMQAALAAVRSAGPGVAGLHLEGPHLSPARRGVHDERPMRRMTDADVERLLALDVGRLLVTLAPEQVEPAQVRRLVEGGVVVSLGHSDATYEQAMALFDAGCDGRHASLQRHEPAAGPRRRHGRCGARRRRRLVRHHRRRPACLGPGAWPSPCAPSARPGGCSW